MASNDVKLLGAWPSPFVLRARIALNIKSVKYEFLEEQFGSKSELLLKSNPVFKKIPVLIHGDKCVSESLVIVEYIDEVWSSGHQIVPSDPFDRANARFWAIYIDDKWFPSIRAVGAAQGEEAKKAALEQVSEGLGLLEDAFNKSSKGKPFFNGDKIGYLDIALGGYLGWLKLTEISHKVKLIDEVKTPGLYKWAQHFCADNAVKDVFPDLDKLGEFAKLLRAKFQAPPQK